MMMTLLQAAQAVNGNLIGEADSAERSFAAVSTDSRVAGQGVLFVALIGERFDAHDFVAEVATKGAAAALVAASQADRLAAAGLPLIVVDDTRLALGRLAAWWRQRFAIPVIAVTGSNGKTTTKEMIAAILRAQAELDGSDSSEGDNAVLATQGNLNNDIGLPLTLLALRRHHRYAVVELGMNHPGEIAYLAALARPTAAVVINALRAHLEGMGSLSAVAREKGSLLEHLAADGVAVIAADSEFAPLWRVQAGHCRTLGFSLAGQGDINVDAQQQGMGASLSIADRRPGAAAQSGVGPIFLHAPGQHNAHNAAAAAAVCLAAGCSITAVASGLAAFAGVKGRLQKKVAVHGALLIDDSYNANPDSVRAAIDVLAGLPGATPRLLALGDMGETGDAASEYHQEVGAYAKSKGIDRLFALGELSRDAVSAFGAGACHYATPESLADDLKSALTPNAAVLVKGSRFMRMERVVALLEAPAATRSTQAGDASCC